MRRFVLRFDFFATRVCFAAKNKPYSFLIRIQSIIYEYRAIFLLLYNFTQISKRFRFATLFCFESRRVCVDECGVKKWGGRGKIIKESNPTRD